MPDNLLGWLGQKEEEKKPSNDLLGWLGDKSAKPTARQKTLPMEQFKEPTAIENAGYSAAEGAANALGVVVEAPLSLASGGPSFIGGLVGAGLEFTKQAHVNVWNQLKEDPVSGANLIQAIENVDWQEVKRRKEQVNMMLGYQPQTEHGQKFTEFLMQPFTAYTQGASEILQKGGMQAGMADIVAEASLLGIGKAGKAVAAVDRGITSFSQAYGKSLEMVREAKQPEVVTRPGDVAPNVAQGPLEVPPETPKPETPKPPDVQKIEQPVAKQPYEPVSPLRISENGNILLGGKEYGRDVIDKLEPSDLEEAKVREMVDPQTYLLSKNYSTKVHRDIYKGTNTTGGMFIGDIDGLKSANDLIGKEAGDLLIESTGESIREVAKEFPELYDTSRGGGADEFNTPIVRGEVDPARIAKISERVNEELRKRVKLEFENDFGEKHDIPIGVTYGYGKNFAEADAAIRAAKGKREFYYNREAQKFVRRDNGPTGPGGPLGDSKGEGIPNTNPEGEGPVLPGPTEKPAKGSKGKGPGKVDPTKQSLYEAVRALKFDPSKILEHQKSSIDRLTKTLRKGAVREEPGWRSWNGFSPNEVIEKLAQDGYPVEADMHINDFVQLVEASRLHHEGKGGKALFSDQKVWEDTFDPNDLRATERPEGAPVLTEEQRAAQRGDVVDRTAPLTLQQEGPTMPTTQQGFGQVQAEAKVAKADAAAAAAPKLTTLEPKKSGVAQEAKFAGDVIKKQPLGMSIEEVRPIVGELTPGQKAGFQAKAMFNAEEAALKEMNRLTPKKIRDMLDRSIVDVRGPLKRALMKYGGDYGKAAVMLSDLIAGTDGKVALVMDYIYTNLYADLNHAKRGVLDNIIQSKRTLELDAVETAKESRYMREHGWWDENNQPTEKLRYAQSNTLPFPEDPYVPYERMRHPMGMTDKLKSYLDNIETIEDLKPEETADLLKRADQADLILKDQLREGYEAGLFSEAGYNAMKDLYYSPRKFMQWLDPEYELSGSGGKITVHDSGIKSLAKGSEELLQKNFPLLAHEYISRIQSRIARNKANQALMRMAIENPNNGFVTLPKIEMGKTEAGFQKPPAGYEPIFVFDKGIRKEMWMPKEYAGDWIKSDPLLNQSLAKAIGHLSGASILKGFATGYNPAFILTNMPRDLALIWMASEEYSPTLVIAQVQQAADLVATLGDAVSRKGRYIDFVNEGGTTDFLTHYGQSRGQDITMEKLYRYRKWLGYVGETSEIWSRLALRERALKNGKTPVEATWAARNYLDFSIGGNFIKAVDTGIPYLNASIQGTRAIVRAALQNPGRFAYQVAQLGVIASSLYYANQKVNPEAWAQIPDRDKEANFIFTTPFYYMDKNGNKRYRYLKIAKDQGQRIFCSLFEAAAEKLNTGRLPGKQLWLSVGDFINTNPTSMVPPVMRAILGYALNKDFWTQEDIWKGQQVKAGEEWTARTAEIFKQAGKLGISPDRMAYAVNSIAPFSNLFVGLVGGGLNELLEREGAGPAAKKSMDELFSAQPWLRRILSSTYPPNEFKGQAEEMQIEVNTNHLIQNRELDGLFNQDKGAKEVSDYIKAQPAEDRERLQGRAKRNRAYAKLENKSFWINLSELDPKSRAWAFKSWIDRMDDATKAKYILQAHSVPGVWSDKFNKEFMVLNELENKSKRREK